MELSTSAQSGWDGATVICGFTSAMLESEHEPK
jgi:hypothetical protein